MKKTLLFLRDVVELYIPMLAFVLMFFSFILQVASRYIIKHPFTWTSDIIVIGFCYTVMLGACYTMRCRSHVQFTMLYDGFGPKLAALTRLLGNLLIIFTFLLLIVPSINFAKFQSYQKTAVLRVNLTWIFIPFVYFLLSIIGYSLGPCIEDFKVLTGKLADSEDHHRAQEAKECTATGTVQEVKQ